MMTSDRCHFKRFVPIICMACMALAVGLLLAMSAAADPPNILILNAYHQGDQWADNELEGVLAVRDHTTREKLPPGSAILHRPESFWRRHRALLLPVGVVVGFLLMAIVALGLATIKLQRAREDTRRGEERLRQHNQLLLHYKQAMESSQNSLAALAPDYRFLFVNQAFLDLYRLERHQVEGRLAMDVFGQEEFGRCCQDNLALCFQGQGARLELPLIHPRLGQRHLDLSCFPMKDAAGNVDGAVIVIADITDRKKSALEQEQLKLQLNQLQKMEAIGALAGGIAHDFNNILFPIVGFAEMIDEDSPEGSKAKEFSREILVATQRAKGLVRQILTFSHQVEKEVKCLRPGPIIEEVVQLIEATFPKTIEIVTDIRPNGPMILADPTHIHQIVLNLVTNAYHAMEAKGGRLTIGLAESRVDAQGGGPPRLGPGAYVVIRVADTGIGIPEEHMEKIFDPYFTTKTKEKGTGLGLSVVHGIVKSYQGEIVVESRLGQGTDFRVYLPACTSGAASEEIQEQAVPTGREHILVVDDEEQIVRMEKQMLEKLGYRVTTRAGSIEALAAFQLDPSAYDLVITDMTMPKMTGDHMAQAMLRIRPDLPVVICTGFSELIGPEKAAAIGIQGFLMKPVVRSELCRLVREVLDKKVSYVSSVSL